MLPNMAKDRWEWLEGLKPESPIDVAVKYVAAMTADALAAMPNGGARDD